MKRLLSAFLVLALLPAPALAAPHGSTTPATPTATTTPPGTANVLPPLSPVGNPPTSTAALPTQNPDAADCKTPALLSAEAARNCKASGSPESAYDQSAFGLDVNVDVGVVDPGGQATQWMDQICSFWFGTLATLLNAIFTLVSGALSFDLFRSDHSGRIPAALGNATRLFTSAILPAILVVGGLVGVRHWWGHRAESRAVSHWLVTIFAVVAGLVVALNPVSLFAAPTRAVNGLASAALGVFSGGGRSAGNFASAEPGLWRSAVERPWCQLEFGSVAWCMAPPDKAMLAAKASVLTHLDQAAGDQAAQNVAKAMIPAERIRLAAAQTNGELFLSFGPNWNARNGKNDSWTLFHALGSDRPDLASFRGPGGVGARVGNLFLITVGSLAFLLMMLYIAVCLLAASVGFVVLLLGAFIVPLAAAFGESGRALVGKWAGYLLLCLVGKLVYALALGGLIYVANVLVDVTASQGWLLAWGLWAGFWAFAFLKRKALFAAMTMTRAPDPLAGAGGVIRSRAASWQRRREMEGAFGGAAPRRERPSRPEPRPHESPEPTRPRPERVPNYQPVRPPEPVLVGSRLEVIEGHARELPPPDKRRNGHGP